MICLEVLSKKYLAHHYPSSLRGEVMKTQRGSECALQSTTDEAISLRFSSQQCGVINVIKNSRQLVGEVRG